MSLLKVGVIKRLSKKNAPGKHDQAEHGSWADGRGTVSVPASIAEWGMKEGETYHGYRGGRPISGDHPGGYFFSPDKESAEWYVDKANGESAGEYDITIEKPLITDWQMTLVKDWFKYNGTLDNLLYDISEKGRWNGRVPTNDTVKANRIIDAKIAQKARSLGYKCIVYTSPRPPAAKEICVLDSRLIKQVKNAPGKHDQSEHGSWAQGHMKPLAPNPNISPEDAAAAAENEVFGYEEKIENKYAKHVDFQDSAPGHVRQVLEALDKVHEKLPFITENYNMIGTFEPGSDGRMLINSEYAWNVFQDIDDHLGPNSKMLAMSNSNDIIFNWYYMNSVADMYESYVQSEESNYHPAGCNNVAASTAHEIGHRYYNYLSTLSDLNKPYPAKNEFIKFHNTWVSSTKGSEYDPVKLSGYAAKSERECFAEAFSAAFYGKGAASANPYTQMVGKMIAADSSGVKHLPGMHDQSTHGNRYGPAPNGDRTQTHVGRSQLEQVIRGVDHGRPDADIYQFKDDSKKAEAYLAGKYPNCKFEFNNMKGKLLDETTRSVDRMGIEYPDIFKRMAYIGTGESSGIRYMMDDNNVVDVAGYYKTVPGEMATEWTKSTPTGNEQVITFNPAYYYDDGTKLAEVLAQASSPSDSYPGHITWHPPGEDDLGSVFYHEFGHAVDAVLSSGGKGNEGDRQFLPMVSIATGTGLVGETFRSLKYQWYDKLQFDDYANIPSKYALKNPGEMFAEAFSSLYSGSQKALDNSYTQSIKTFMDYYKQAMPGGTPHVWQGDAIVDKQPKDVYQSWNEQIAEANRRLGLKSPAKSALTKILKKNAPGKHDQAEHGSWAADQSDPDAAARRARSEARIAELHQQLRTNEMRQRFGMIDAVPKFKDAAEAQRWVNEFIGPMTLSFDTNEDSDNYMSPTGIQAALESYIKMGEYDPETALKCTKMIGNDLTGTGRAYAATMMTSFNSYTLAVTPDKFNSPDMMDEEFNEDIKAGFHPQYDTARFNSCDSCICHEIGHNFYDITMSKFERAQFYTVVRNAGKDDITAISRYALKDMGETAAETYTKVLIGTYNSQNPLEKTMHDILEKHNIVTSKKNAPGKHDQAEHGSWAQRVQKQPGVVPPRRAEHVTEANEPMWITGEPVDRGNVSNAKNDPQRWDNRDDLTQDEKDALWLYQGLEGAGRSDQINQFLRKGDMAFCNRDTVFNIRSREITQNMNDAVNNIDSAIEKSALGIDIHLWRGMNSDINFDKMKVGTIYSDKGYSSSTSTEEWANMFADNRDGEAHLMVIDAKKGDPALYCSTTEREYIWGRNSAFEITDIEHDDDDFVKRTIYRVKYVGVKA